MARDWPRRSHLFVGALALEGLPAALASGADLVCLDLEDPVPADRKDEAREAAMAALATNLPVSQAQLVVRTNALSSPAGRADVNALLEGPVRLGAILLPMVRSPDEIVGVADRIETSGRALDLYAIIETPVALDRAIEIASSHPRLRAIYFGGNDLSKALGCEMAWEPLLHARSRTVHAAAMAGIDCLDAPYPALDDLPGLRENCLRVRALGMTGKCARHPAQIPVIREVFSAPRAP